MSVHLIISRQSDQLAAYVDVASTNDSSRAVYKIQLELVRHVAFYKNAAASSAFQSVDQRVPERIVTRTISTNALTVKSDRCDNPDWKGVAAGARETVVCQVSVPANQLSISAGRYFGVRYVINVVVCTKGGDVQLELPITIVHINSLDVMPASVKAVSKMIAAYASPEPQSPRSVRSTSYSAKRASLPILSGALTRHIVPEEVEVGVTDLPKDIRNSETPVSNVARGTGPETTTRNRRSFSVAETAPESLEYDLASTKPGIQCDLRRALSLDYQTRFSRLDISAERSSYTQGAPLARRSPDRKRRDLTENLAHRLHRERTRNPSFYDVV